MNASAQTAVVCDTTAYLPDALVAERGIETISLYVSVDGEQERESEISDYAGFYERLRASRDGATTSQPSIGDFLAVYEPLLDAGRDIVSIHISAGISGTFEAASQARQRLIEEGKGGERIQVFDSRSAAGGMGLMVLGASAAAAAAARGAERSWPGPRRRAALKMWFAIDTLEYLRRGGRIGGARAWIGSALKIKPILTLEEEITPVERVRTRARSLERLRDYARQRHESGADGWVVQHIQAHETANALIDDCREIFGREPVFVSEIGAVLGAHVGPGLLGVGSVPDARWSPGPRFAGGGAALPGRRSQSRRRRRRRSAAVCDRGPGGASRSAPLTCRAAAFDRASELLALEIDVAADLRRRAARRPGPWRAHRVRIGAHFFSFCKHLLGQLRLLDRLLGDRRRPGPDRAVAK